MRLHRGIASQQFAGTEETFYGLVVKPESTLVEVKVESTDVVEFGETLNVLEA